MDKSSGISSLQIVFVLFLIIAAVVGVFLSQKLTQTQVRIQTKAAGSEDKNLIPNGKFKDVDSSNKIVGWTSGCRGLTASPSDGRVQLITEKVTQFHYSGVCFRRKIGFNHTPIALQSGKYILKFEHRKDAGMLYLRTQSDSLNPSLGLVMTRTIHPADVSNVSTVIFSVDANDNGKEFAFHFLPHKDSEMFLDNVSLERIDPPNP